MTVPMGISRIPRFLVGEFSTSDKSTTLRLGGKTIESARTRRRELSGRSGAAAVSARISSLSLDYHAEVDHCAGNGGGMNNILKSQHGSLSLLKAMKRFRPAGRRS